MPKEWKNREGRITSQEETALSWRLGLPLTHIFYWLQSLKNLGLLQIPMRKKLQMSNISNNHIFLNF